MTKRLPLTLALGLFWGLLSGLPSSATAQREPLTVTATTFWPNPVDRREVTTVTVTYSAPTDGTYALYVDGRDSDLAYEHKQLIGGVTAGTTGTWTWSGRDRDGVPLPRDTYNVWLLQSDGTDYIEFWPEVARIPISLHNSTERLVVDDYGDGQKIKVNQFILSNGALEVSAGFRMDRRSKRPKSLSAGFDVAGVAGGYYASAIRRPSGRFSTRLVYTRSLPGDAHATTIKCRGFEVRTTQALYELAVPRRCMKKASISARIRGFFLADDRRTGYDQPYGQVDGYWTYWTRATARGA